MAWADDVAPSLASGLFITRIGCYLFGCDFGKRLPADAPPFLQTLGTFPHWTQGTLEAGEGAPAYSRHLELYKGTSEGAELLKMGHSFPVHPTQIYESLCGLLLLGLLLLQRQHQKFRGQIFFTFAFAYGYLRFLLEMLRDDAERGEYGPSMAEHVLIPGALLAMSLGLCFGLAIAIKNPGIRLIVRVLGFVPPVIAFFVLKPPSFGSSVTIQLSTSQWIGLTSALLVSFFYARFWDEARKSPAAAMGPGSLGPGATRVPAERDDEEDDEAAHNATGRESDGEADDASEGPTGQLSESK
jgi:phosphatidylglycerol:prolipoprotein diacylglycerol transferase